MISQTKEARMWFSVLDAVLKLPGSRIDREVFLRKQYEQYCDSGTVEKILRSGAVNAGVELTLMDKAASGVIDYHKKAATAISVVTGIPGGLAMAAAIPADVTQFYYHVIVTAQKLSYIYGLENLEEDEDYFKSVLTVCMGVMAGVKEADEPMNALIEARFSDTLEKTTLGKVLDKTVTRIAMVIGLNLLKRSVFKTAIKVLPVVGGLVSGGITLLSFVPMCNNLKNKFSDGVNAARKKKQGE